MVKILREADAGPVAEVAKRHGVSDATIYAWRKRYGELESADVKPIWRRGPVSALLHHSDQGSQYTSEQFQRLLKEHGVTCSMSRSGDCWDNAAMESFFSTLKIERTNRTNYQTRDEARADVFDYIERFYNLRRRHSTLGYLSPVDYERSIKSG